MKIFTSLAVAAALFWGANAAHAGTFSYESVVPEAGSTIEIGDNVQVQFPNAISLSENHSLYEVKFTYHASWGDGAVFPYDTDENGVVMDGKLLDIKFNPESWNQFPGSQYTLYVEAGVFVDAEGNTNEEINIPYVMAQSEGSGDEPATSLGITIKNNTTFGEVTEIITPINILVDPMENTVYDPSNPIMIYKDFFEEIEVTVEDMMGWWFKIMPNGITGDITEPGEYQLVIPAGAFVNNDSGLTNEEVSYIWNVVDSGDPVVITLLNNRNEGDVPSITLPINLSVEPAEGTVYDENVMIEMYQDFFTDIQIQVVKVDESTYSVVPLNIEGSITTPGTYELYIPEGAFVNGLAKNEGITFTWNVVEDGDLPPAGEPTLEPTTYPASGAYNGADYGIFDYVNLNFIGTSTPITVNPDKVISIVNTETWNRIFATAVYNDRSIGLAGYPIVNVTFDEAITENGDYQLVIPQAAFVDGEGNYNPELVYYYNVTGLSNGQVATDIQLVSISPNPDEPLYTLLEGQSVKLTLNDATGVGFAILNVYEDGEFMTQFSNSSYIKIVGNNVIFENAQWDWTFYEGRTYTFKFELFDYENPPTTRTLLAEFTAEYQGATPTSIHFSDIMVTDNNFNPVPGSMISSDDNSVAVKFAAPVNFISGIVTCGGQYANMADVTAEPNALRDEWNVIIPSSFLSGNFGSVTVIMSFTDDNGNYVSVANYDPTAIGNNLYPYYDVNTGAMTSIAANYNSIEAGSIVLVTPEAGEVSALSEFTLTFGLGITWGAIEPSDVKLYNAEGEEVAYVESVTSQANIEQWGDDSNRVNTYLIIRLNETITAPGNYSLVLPWEALTLGTDIYSVGYKGQIVNYTITTTSINSVIGSAANADVYNLQGMRVLTKASASDMRNLQPGIYIANGKKFIVK